jgi:hypothetical protein
MTSTATASNGWSDDYLPGLGTPLAIQASDVDNRHCGECRSYTSGVRCGSYFLRCAVWRGVRPWLTIARMSGDLGVEALGSDLSYTRDRRTGFYDRDFGMQQGSDVITSVNIVWLLRNSTVLYTT